MVQAELSLDLGGGKKKDGSTGSGTGLPSPSMDASPTSVTGQAAVTAVYVAQEANNSVDKDRGAGGGGGDGKSAVLASLIDDGLLETCGVSGDVRILMDGMSALVKAERTDTAKEIGIALGVDVAATWSGIDNFGDVTVTSVDVLLDGEPSVLRMEALRGGTQVFYHRLQRVLRGLAADVLIDDVRRAVRIADIAGLGGKINVDRDEAVEADALMHGRIARFVAARILAEAPRSSEASERMVIVVRDSDLVLFLVIAVSLAAMWANVGHEKVVKVVREVVVFFFPASQRTQALSSDTSFELLSKIALAHLFQTADTANDATRALYKTLEVEKVVDWTSPLATVVRAACENTRDVTSRARAFAQVSATHLALFPSGGERNTLYGTYSATLPSKTTQDFQALCQTPRIVVNFGMTTDEVLGQTDKTDKKDKKDKKDKTDEKDKKAVFENNRLIVDY